MAIRAKKKRQKRRPNKEGREKAGGHPRDGTASNHVREEAPSKVKNLENRDRR